jgi:hypothetical protein
MRPSRELPTAGEQAGVVRPADDHVDAAFGAHGKESVQRGLVQQAIASGE